MIRITKQLDELDIAAKNLLMELQSKALSFEAITSVYVALTMQLEQLREIDQQLARTE